MVENKTDKESKPEARSTGLSALPWVAGAILLLGVAIMAGLYWERTATVQSVRFSNAYFVSDEELEQQADIPLGVKPDSLDYKGIMDRVKKIPYVKDAQVRVEPSGDLVIHITERRPLALLADGTHKFYVDAEGMQLPLVLGKAVDVPVLYGFETTSPGDTLKSKNFEVVSRFLKHIAQNPVYDATISEVAWTEAEGVVALSNDNGVKLIFGKGDFETKLRNWEAFYAGVIRQKGMENMETVDLRFRGQIVTRER